MAKELEFKIKVVEEGQLIEKTAKSIKELEDAVASLSTELDNAPIGSDKFKELQAGLKQNEKALDTATIKSKGFAGALGQMGGAIGGAAQGFMGLGKAAMAFVANPIGAVVAALGLVFTAVYKAIQSTEKGMMAMNKIMGAFGGIIDPIVKIVGELAAVLAEGVVAAIEGVVGLIGKLIPGFEESAKAGMDLAQSLNEIDVAEGDLAVARAQANKQLAEAREILSDTNKTLEERKVALAEIRKSEEDLAAQEVALAQKTLAAAREKIRLQGESKANLDAEEAALIKLAGAEQDFAAKRRLFNREEKKLTAEVEADKKAAADEAKKRSDEAAALAKKRRDEALALEKDALTKTATLKNEASLLDIKDEEAKAKRQLEIQQEAARAEVQLKIDALEKKKKRTKEENAALAALQDQQTQLEINQAKQLEALLDEQKKVRLDKEKAFNDELTNLKNEFILASIEDERERARVELEIQNQAAQDAIKTSEQTEAQKQELLLQLQQNYLLKQQELQAKFDAEDFMKQQEQNALLAENQQLSFEERFAALDANEQAIRANAQLTEEERTRLLEENSKKRDQIEQESSARRVAIFNASAQVLNDSLNALSAVNEARQARELKAAGNDAAKRDEINKKYFEKNKKVQIATAIVNTIQSAVSAFASLAAIPVVGPVLGGIAAAAALVTGYANVDKIRSTEYQSAGGGGGGGAGGGGAEAPPPQPSKFADGGLVSGPGTSRSDSIPAMLSAGESVINANSTQMYGGLLSAINMAGGGKGFAVGGVAGQQLNDLTSNQMVMPVIKTYVVASEMSSQQEADARINQIARL
jgi:hypothetical protein